MWNDSKRKSDNMKSYKEWIKKANDDLNLVKFAMNHVADWIILFHLQQASEKFLKAYLIFHNIQPKRTHDIGNLIKECSKINKKFNKLFSFDIEIFDNAVTVRYPFFGDQINKEVIEKAMRITEAISELVLSEIEKEKNKYH